MYKPMKKNKNLKAIFLFVIVCILSLTTACQPTPDKPIVIDKNDLGQKIMQTAAPQPSGEPEDGQQMWQETLDFQSGVQVVIDAKLELPQVKAYRDVKGFSHGERQLPDSQCS